MPNLRSIRVGVEHDGVLKWYDSDRGFRVSTKGSKARSERGSTAAATIWGMDRDTRGQLARAAQASGAKSRLVVEVGRAQTGVARIFVGDITRVDTTDAPEIAVTLEAVTGKANAYIVEARDGVADEWLSELAEDIANRLGVQLEFEAQDKRIANASASGTRLSMLRLLSTAGGVKAYLDDDALVVTDFDKPREGRVRILNKRSGMIGLPTVTEAGIEVRYTIEGSSVIGGILRVESDYQHLANGDFRIDTLSWEADSHGTSFYYKAECVRL